MPIVSIILPAFNAEKYISGSIQSVISQTFEDWELLIIEDGSKDNTLQIIENFSDPRIKIIRLHTNKGIVEALNTGIDAAQGKYIARMDADDICAPNRLEIQVSAMEANPSLILVGSEASIIEENNRFLGSFMKKPATDKEIKASLLFSCPFIHPTILIRKYILDKTGIRYDTAIRYAQDYVLYSRLWKHGDFANLQMPLLQYRVHLSVERVTQDANSEGIIKSRMLAWRNMLNEFQVEASNELLQVHDKFCYYSQRIKKEEIKLIPAYFSFLLHLHAKNEQIEVFDKTCFQRNIVSQLERVLTYPHLPINTFISLWFKSASIMPPGVFFSIPYKSMKHRLKSSKMGQWMINKMKQF